MSDALTALFNDFDSERLSRRQLVRAFGLAAVGAPFAAALGQGRCRLRLGAVGCDTTAINPVFEPTEWKTVWRDHISFSVTNYKESASFYTNLLGWTPTYDEGSQIGIQPWDTDGVKAELLKRGLNARVDTSTDDEIHVAAYKSYHTTTPSGFDLQLSAVTHGTRLTLPTAVTPRRAPGAP